ncbi:MAG: LysM peptidoglycan-binding domain-containing protein [Leptospiraceae bacterium]|nr:LysM peptidoglycan-binding domain-containing protein [Leptospiraceae bacterium]
MKIYIVKNGDKGLYDIARKIFGDGKKWKDLAKWNNLTSRSVIRVGQRLKYEETKHSPSPRPVVTKPVLNNHPNNPASTKNLDNNEIIKESYTGRYRIDWFKDNFKYPQRFTSSEWKLLDAISFIEGAFDAINTWDNAIFSFGILQWTVGSGKWPGELPVLIKFIKENNSRLAKKIQSLGIGVKLHPRDPNSGYFILNRAVLDTSEKKKVLQTRKWVNQFKDFGKNLDFCYMECLFALERLKRFYFKRHVFLKNLMLSEVLTSEYSVAILYEAHVHRPSNVTKILKQALMNLNLLKYNLRGIDARTEARIIQEFIRIKHSHYKTDFEKKIAATRVRKISSRKMSRKKDSFVSILR